MSFFSPLIFSLSIFTSVLCFAQSTQSDLTSKPKLSEDYYVLCRNQKIVRSFRIEKKSGKYFAYYTKSGQDKVVGEAQMLSVCVNVINSIRDTLVKAGWKCKEAKKSGVSHLQEPDTKE